MKNSKRLTQGIILMISTAALIGTAVVADVAEVPTDMNITAKNGKAGIVASLEQTESRVFDEAQLADVTVAKTETQIVTVASKSEAAAAADEKQENVQVEAQRTQEAGNTEKKTEETEKEDTDQTGKKPEKAKEDTVKTGKTGKKTAQTEEKTEETDKKPEEKQQEAISKTEKKWQNKVMADVKDFLCIRKKGNGNAEIVGKLYPTSVATVVKQGKTWTKIKSGSVKGYVKNEYLLFGSDAYENAKKVCKKYAYVQTDGLNVRGEASEDAKIIAVVNKGDQLLFNKKADKKDGWVAVTVKNSNGYVSADYVKVKLGTTDAVSIEEEIAAQKAKEAAEAKAAAASSSATQNAPTSASVDDTTLLAAIIQCEAGSECYEGKVAVGAVVLNRMRSGRWPNSISGVIYQRGQFSPVGNGALARVLANGNISGSCKNAAADALAGSDPTGGKKFFRRVNGRAGLVIGNHVFY